jgi:F0F1-type ATP synthase epsilon subunit
MYAQFDKFEGLFWADKATKDSNVVELYKYKVAAVSGGFIDVKDSIIVYTDHIEWAEDIDVQRSLQEKAKAEAWLEANKETAIPANIEKAELAIAKAKIRASVAEGGRRRKK